MNEASLRYLSPLSLIQPFMLISKLLYYSEHMLLYFSSHFLSELSPNTIMGAQTCMKLSKLRWEWDYTRIRNFNRLIQSLGSRYYIQRARWASLCWKWCSIRSISIEIGCRRKIFYDSSFQHSCWSINSDGQICQCIYRKYNNDDCRVCRQSRNLGIMHLGPFSQLISQITISAHSLCILDYQKMLSSSCS